MSWWEEDHLYAMNNPYWAHIAWYGRYIDDLLLVWQGEVSSLTDFHIFLNTNDHNLHFTMEFDRMTIHFLDVTLYHDGNKVLTKIFRKGTTGNGLLRADSCHPKNITKNLPVGKFVRARRSYATDETYAQECMNITSRLRHCVYSRSVINYARAKYIAGNKTRREYLFGENKKKTSNNSDKLTFSTPYSTDLRSRSKIKIQF